MKRLTPFHHAFPCLNLSKTIEFYKSIGCTLGRGTAVWQDFNLFGHQIVAHQIPPEHQNTWISFRNTLSNHVDGHQVPIPHFGVVLEWNQYHDWVKTLKVDFVMEPTIRFKGQVGEQATCFFKDPSGNALEFKSFKNLENVFAT